MAENSAIEWTDATWNPTTGCTRVSDGCRNCYAFQLHDMRHEAHKAGKSVPAQYAKPFKELQMFEDRLTAPLSWRKPRRIFVNSMSDLFHKDVPFEFIDRVFATMASASQHTFQVLTKRPERMADYMQRVSEKGIIARERYVADLRDYHLKNLEEYEEGFTLPSPPTAELRFIYDSACEQEAKNFKYERNPKPLGHGFSGGEYHWRKWPLSNVWLGTSVENQAAADERIPHLLSVPAAVRFLSCEPLLGPVALGQWIVQGWCPSCDSMCFRFGGNCRGCGGPATPLMHWVIVGGESGPGARPCNVAWIRSIVEQCKAAGVPVFVKQLGAVPHGKCGDGGGSCLDNSCCRIPLRDKKGGDMAEWHADLRVRQFPEAKGAVPA